MTWANNELVENNYFEVQFLYRRYSHTT